MFMSRGDRNLGVAFQTHPGVRPYQAAPSMGFSRQEYWNGVSLPSPKAHLGLGKLGINNIWDEG